MSKALAKVRAMITVNKTIAKLGGNLIGTHPAARKLALSESTRIAAAT